MTIDIEKLAEITAIHIEDTNGYVEYLYDKSTLQNFAEAYAAKVLEDKEHVTQIDAVKFQEALDYMCADKDKEIAELQAIIKDLREALLSTQDALSQLIYHGMEQWAKDKANDAYQYIEKSLSKTPSQSMTEHDNATIERCAKVCEKEYLTYKNTEEAHYRLSSTYFIPSNFGFDMNIIKKSKYDAEAIRAIKHEVK